MVVAFDRSAWARFLVGETGLTTQATMIVVVSEHNLTTHAIMLVGIDMNTSERR